MQSKLIMVAWNAWSPFQNNAFTIADTITLELVGGPRPNPDDVLCLKNLLRINHANFGETSQLKFSLKFNFAILDFRVRIFELIIVKKKFIKRSHYYKFRIARQAYR